jgi:hypothetical protein
VLARTASSLGKGCQFSAPWGGSSYLFNADYSLKGLTEQEKRWASSLLLAKLCRDADRLDRIKEGEFHELPQPRCDLPKLHRMRTPLPDAEKPAACATERVLYNYLLLEELASFSACAGQRSLGTNSRDTGS